MTATIKLNHKTKQIIIVDVSNLKKEQAATKLNEAHNEIATLPPKSALIVTDVTDIELANEVINGMMEFAKKNTPYVKASAVVGANKMTSLITFNVSNTAGRKLNLFNTRAEAMDWLVSQP